MGRIADALKRADGERRLSAGGAACGSIVDLPKPAFRAGDQPHVFEFPDPSQEGESHDKPIELREGMSESLIAYYEPSSLISEQYRALRTRMLSQNPQHEHRVIAITSGAPREGKSVTTLNLSSTLAEIRHLKVVAVDADFRRSSLAKMLDLPSEPGLADVLGGQADYEEVIQKTPIPNLYLIPAGNTGDRPAAELLASSGTRQIFRRMQNDFHYSVVDTPPATTVTDVGIVGQMCSGVIMIVRMNRSHQAVAKQAVKLLQVNNIPIIGCLIIGRDTPGERYGYGYGYYYYHRYYNNYYNYYDKDAKKR